MKRANRGWFKLYVTTSALALTLASAPLHIDSELLTFQLKLAQAESSCFTGKTRILMANGQSRAIARVQVGDFVMGPTGKANRVIGVEVVPLGARKLYGLNEVDPFFTEEHPFKSPIGWRSISPQATAQENRKLRTLPMQIGDLLVIAEPRSAGIQGNLALMAELLVSLEEITEITSVSVSAPILVFNLLLDGDHSYIANGFVVHNKGDDGGEGGDGDDGGEGGEGDDSGEGGEGGESGSSESDDDTNDDDDSDDDDDDGDKSGKGSKSSKNQKSEQQGTFAGSSQKSGNTLSEDEEKGLISTGWQ